MTLDDILDVLRALEAAGVDYAVFGGLAMAAHGLDRGTRDLDLFVDPEPANVARLRDALKAAFDDPDVDQITSEDLNGKYPAIQYGPPDRSFTIDIVSRLGTAFAFGDLEIERIVAGQTMFAVVSVRTLYAMKHDTVRPRDADDAARLRHRFGDQVNP